MFARVTWELCQGFLVTLEIFALTLAFAIPLALPLAFGSMSKCGILRWICRVLVWVIRGTPLMLQLIIVYYGPGIVGEWARNNPNPGWFVSWFTGWRVLDRMTAVLIAFVINYACYFSEIYRGGIEAIPRGQYEAAQVLGMTKAQTFTRVILMQVIRRIMAPMGNEIITLVKDTSLARIVAVYELIWAAQRFIKLEGLLWPLLYTGVFYLLFNGLLTMLFRKMERKLNYYGI